MKKLVWSLLLAASMGFLFTACNKEEDLATEDVSTTEELANAENLILDIADQVDEYLEAAGLEEGTADFRGDDCPEIILAEPKGVFPNTITIDFGTDGCEGPHGRVRKGKIVVVLSDTLSKPGATRTITLVNFSINDVALEGTKVFTNVGKNDEGIPCFTRDVKVKITFPNGAYVQWAAQHKVCLIKGADTRTVWDNVWAVRGSSTGMNSWGGTFSSTILEPLIKKKTCPWIVSGIREVVVNGKTRVIDYGDGNCDRLAQVTLANGKTIIIRLR